MRVIGERIVLVDAVACGCALLQRRSVFISLCVFRVD